LTPKSVIFWISSYWGTSSNSPTASSSAVDMAARERVTATRRLSVDAEWARAAEMGERNRENSGGSERVHGQM